jgi:(1->4)-alpha-D-glucan 1-alpha-D-glucosylmutase
VLILKTAMASDLQLLAHRLNRISERHRRSRDFTLNALRVALREIIACFPVYRTYVRRGEVSERDRQVVCRAAAQAKRRNPVSNAAVFDFIRDVLLLESPPEMDEPGRREEELFVGRFQQVTSPVTAKGIEDTAFYRWFPLASLSEVGGEPARGSVGLEEFHRHNRQRQAQWPRSLLATTTHDSKRSEDVRARINVLSEIPHLWRVAVNRWARWNRRRRGEVDGQPAPSRNDEYLFYQSLAGIWPLERPAAAALAQLTERVQMYMEKAAREAKVRTSWLNPNAEYEAAVRAFVAAVLDAGPRNRFLADFQGFHEQTVNWGLYAALSQTLLKLTSPGVPDIYQGQELWDFSLVDPDNRRPVDFALRRKMLKRLGRQTGRNGRRLPRLARQLALDPRDPRIKLFLTWRTLQFRRRWAEVFQGGDYVPLEARGAGFEHVCAFARRRAASSDPDRPAAIVIAPRWFARLTPGSQGSLVPPPPLGREVWQDTRLVVEPLPSATWKSVLTGQSYSPEDGCLWVGDVLSDFPVALLSNVTPE